MGGPKNIGMRKALIPYAVLFGLVGLVGFGHSTFEQDKAECADKLVGLATCLNFVGGEASRPTPDCCSGLKQVVEKSTKCLCVLIKDRNEPKLGIKFNITRTLELPSTCHVPLNVTTCIELLHLAPNSTDAKVFEDFSKSLRDRSSPSSPTFSSTGRGNSTAFGVGSNNGGDGKRWAGVFELAFGTYLLWLFIGPIYAVLYV